MSTDPLKELLAGDVAVAEKVCGFIETHGTTQYLDVVGFAQILRRLLKALEPRVHAHAVSACETPQTRENANESPRTVGEALVLHESPPAPPARDGIGLIAAERTRQQHVEGWTPEHDDSHVLGELVSAAMGYALYASFQTRRQAPPNEIVLSRWPWERSWWKPSTNPVRNLEKAGALIAAEIDRLLRSARREEPPAPTGIAVAGNRMERPIDDFVRACEHLLGDEQVKPNPDNALIAVLCDAIRLTRELTASARGGAPPTVPMAGVANLVDALVAEKLAARGEAPLPVTNREET